MEFKGTKYLESERLFLRKIEKEDYKVAYKNWCSSDMVSKYVLWDKHKNEDETKQLYDKLILDYENSQTFRWIVGLKYTKELIGMIEVSKKYLFSDTCEISYSFGESFWNNGYGTETVKRVMEYLFNECHVYLISA